jgi:hypothetical protein
MTVVCNKTFFKFEIDFLKVVDADFAYWSSIRRSPIMMKRRGTCFSRMPARPLLRTIDCVTYWNLLGNDPYVFDPVEVSVGTDAAILAKHGIRSRFLSVHNCVIIVLVVVCIIPIVENVNRGNLNLGYRL